MTFKTINFPSAVALIRMKGIGGVYDKGAESICGINDREWNAMASDEILVKRHEIDGIFCLSNNKQNYLYFIEKEIFEALFFKIDSKNG